MAARWGLLGGGPLPWAGGPPAFSLSRFGDCSFGFYVYLHGRCLVCDDPMVTWLVGPPGMPFQYGYQRLYGPLPWVESSCVHACTAFSLLGLSQWHLMHRHDRLVNHEAQIGHVLARSPSCRSFGGLG